MRITGGLARGVSLRVPKGDAVRPATDAMRQAVFSSLGARVVGARFLDLFAGAGGYGLEALSRGAAGGVFVERDARAVDCIRENLAAVCRSARRSDGDAIILLADALKHPGGGGAAPDLVFIDPPYEIIASAGPQLFEQLNRLLAEVADPVIVFEMPGEESLSPAGWTCVKRLGKGARQPSACFFKRSPATP